VATPNYSWEKRQRELAKKRKKEEKAQKKADARSGVGRSQDAMGVNSPEVLPEEADNQGAGQDSGGDGADADAGGAGDGGAGDGGGGGDGGD